MYKCLNDKPIVYSFKTMFLSWIRVHDMIDAADAERKHRKEELTLSQSHLRHQTFQSEPCSSILELDEMGFTFHSQQLQPEAEIQTSITSTLPNSDLYLN